MKMLRFLLCTCFLILITAGATIADVTVRWVETDQPVRSTGPRPSKALASPALVLPFYRAETNAGAAGETTLYAVRNNTSNPMDVRVSVFPNGGDAIVFDVPIAARGVYTADVRSLAGLPSQQGVATGSVLFEALGDSLPEAALSGDYFRVDTAGAAANGGAIVPLADTDCKQWTHRILNGGGFDGGTRVAVLALDSAPGTTLSGTVFSEGGEIVGVVAVESGQAAFELTAEDLDLPVDFGSIDWVFAGDGHGLVNTTFSALGLFSVGAEASCVDALGSDPEPPPPGTEVFELPGTFLDCQGCGNWQYDMPFGGQRQFSRVVMDFDLFVASWDSNRPSGFHCLFWLNNGTRWQDMMGYLNSRGTQNRTVFQSNGPLGNPIGVETYASPGVQLGRNYSVHYEYDTVAKAVWYEIREADGSLRVSDSIALPANVGPLSTSYAFIQFGSQPNGAVESLTEGWRWSNFRIEWIP